MSPIPKDRETRERLIRMHAECVASMKGVAGCAIVKAGKPGDVTEISGGMLNDDLLRRVLIYMWSQPAPDKLVVICTKTEKEWRIARLPHVKGQPPRFIDDRVFSDEHTPQHEIFVMRINEMAAANAAAA
ncbi:N,N-dimethylformamidase, small subunit [Mesorhizobium sp. CO1-1-8]|uniref:N,N-dimethylformamidase, small subunit n=1 Tax=Mesorhizobium sp. CO1-1-8 TaxID=2876631 RepID=UPI001CD0D718|nr:N,N-dimethylformamidase, small subunit [Mesorhizobium sp. CO1-1-8]MBZ9772458.1 N,N-dimethylformamidase, small subunit [Mesorhizobium sp. CO1-1-8]